MLADSAAALVIGQIEQASTQTGPGLDFAARPAAHLRRDATRTPDRLLQTLFDATLAA